MTINFDTRVAAGAVPERLNRHNAQARQERWMAELQDALFVHPAPAPAAAAADGQPGQVSSPHGAAGAARTAPDASASAPVMTARAGGLPRNSAPAAGAAVAVAAAAPAAVAATDLAPAALPAGAAPAAAFDAVAAPSPASPALTAGPQPGAVPFNPFAFAYGMTAPVPPGVTAALPDPAASVTPAAPRAASGLLWAGGGASGADGAVAAEPPEQAPVADAAGEEQQYARRLLHLYQDQDGVQAWLRDAALTPGQVAAVTAALAAELAGQGQALATLTVNGKRIEADALRRAADAARDGAFESFAAGSPPPAHQPGKVTA